MHARIEVLVWINNPLGRRNFVKSVQIFSDCGSDLRIGLRTKIMIVPKSSYYGGNFLPKLFRSMRSVKRELDSSV